MHNHHSRKRHSLIFASWFRPRSCTFLRWPSLSLKISSCSWYSACDNLQKHRNPPRETKFNQAILCWKKRDDQLKAPYASLSVPLVLLLRLFCSRLGGGVWAIEGGLRLANNFLCRSMSSRWELILSCCLEKTPATTLLLHLNFSPLPFPSLTMYFDNETRYNRLDYLFVVFRMNTWQEHSLD